MGCNCKWMEIIIAVVILIVTIWPGLIGATASWWLTVIAAVVLLLHAFMCKQCAGVCDTDMGVKKEMPMAKAMPVKKTVTKKKKK